MSADEGFNSAQEAASEQIKHLMREHFDAGVCVLRSDGEDDDCGAERLYLWHGGADSAVGLLRKMETKLLSDNVEENIEDNE